MLNIVARGLKDGVHPKPEDEHGAETESTVRSSSDVRESRMRCGSTLWKFAATATSLRQLLKSNEHGTDSLGGVNGGSFMRQYFVLQLLAFFLFQQLASAQLLAPGDGGSPSAGGQPPSSTNSGSSGTGLTELGTASVQVEVLCDAKQIQRELDALALALKPAIQDAEGNCSGMGMGWKGNILRFGPKCNEVFEEVSNQLEEYIRWVRFSCIRLTSCFDPGSLPFEMQAHIFFGVEVKQPNGEWVWKYSLDPWDDVDTITPGTLGRKCTERTPLFGAP